MQKKVQVTIKGESALLMHAFPMVEIKAIEKLSKEEQAEYSAYRHPQTKELYIPGINLQRCFVSGATYSKGKGRSTLQKSVAACVRIEPEYLLLGTKDYEVDSRPVVIAATKGRILRHRPKISNWGTSFTLYFDSELLTENQVRQVVDDSGIRCGILDFRPEKKGPFGTFKVTSWKA